jgi:hypothetical protein
VDDYLDFDGLVSAGYAEDIALEVLPRSGLRGNDGRRVVAAADVEDIVAMIQREID